MLKRVGAWLALTAPVCLLLPALSGDIEGSSDAIRLWSGLTLRLADGPLAPLSAMVVQAASWLPMGPVSWRVELAFLGVTGLASLALYATGKRLARHAGVGNDALAMLVGLAVASLALGNPIMLAATASGDGRTLAVLLFCVVMERVSFALSVGGEASGTSETSTEQCRSALGTVAFVVGLLLMEFPLWGALALPGLVLVWRAPTTTRTSGQHRGWVLMGGLGLAPGVYGALRWAPESGYGPGLTVPVLESEKILEGFLAMPAPWLCGLVFIGAGGTAWRLAKWDLWGPFLAWWAAAGTLVAAPGLPAEVRLQGLSLLVLATAPLVVLPVAHLIRIGRGQSSALGWAVVAGLCAVGAAQMHRFAGDRELRFRSRQDLLAESTVARLPPRSVVLLSSVQSRALLLAARVEAGLRPDLVLVDRARLRNYGYLRSVLSRTSALRSVLSTTLLDGTLSLPHLQSLAGVHGVALELLEADVPELFDGVRPSGLLYEVLAGGATGVDVRSRGAQRTAMFARLYRDLAQRTLAPETGLWFARQHRVNALHAMAMGQHGLARDALSNGARIQPADKRFADMQVYLADRAGATRLDIAPLIDFKRQEP